MSRKFLSVLITALVVGFASACVQESNSVAEAVPPPSSATTPVPTEPDKPPVEEIVVPGKSKPTFFETIDVRAKIAGIGDLRKLSLEDNDIEARVWYGFGLTGIEGFVLSRRSNDWKASHLGYVLENKSLRSGTAKLTEPAGGWDVMWRNLLQEGLLILPDAGEINCEVPMHDGFSYVVEIKKGSNYRTYMYGNPDVAVRELKCKQAASMIKIGQIIEDRFSLKKLRQ